MTAFLIPHDRSLIQEILLHLEGNDKDYSANLVAFPGKRPSHFLRKALAEQGKSSLIPPRIFSMDELVDYLYEEQLGLQKRKLETIDAIAILYEIHRSFSRPIWGDSFITPDSFFPIGLKILGDIEEFYIEGINSQKVKGIEHLTEQDIPQKTLKGLQSLSYFYEQFYQKIETFEFSTRSLRYRAVSERIDETGFHRFQKIIFAGFFALTRSEKDLFKKLLNKDNSLFLFQDGPGIKEKVKELGVNSSELIVANGKINDLKAPEPKIYFYKSPDTHGQIFGLSKILKTKLEKNESLDEKTAICLPSSESLFPLLHQSLSLLEEDNYNISIGYPLYRTPIYSFFNNLMELITSMDGDRFYLPDYLTFVLHPYTKNIYFHNSPEITRIMFHTIEEELTKTRVKMFLTLSEIEEEDDLFEAILQKLPESAISNSKSPLNPPFTKGNPPQPPSKRVLAESRFDFAKGGIGGIKEHLKTIHKNTIKSFLSFSNVEDFAMKGIKILNYIYGHSTAQLHPFFHPFAETFMKSLDNLSRSLIKNVSFEDPIGYFNLLRKYIMTCRTPFEGTPLRGVQVLGFLETRNLHFGKVFVLDVNEGTIPDTQREDTLLPFKAREILGLPTYIDRERLTAYYFENLINGADEVHLFFVEKDKKERSRFIEKLIWEKQKKAKKPDTKEYVKSVQYAIKLANKHPGSISKTDEMVGFLKNYFFNATSVDTYLSCPLKFYYHHVLNLQKKEVISGDIEKTDIGDFVHRVLSKYFQEKKGHVLTAKDLNLEEMNHIVDGLFKEYYGKELSGATYLLRNQIKSHMRDFLEKYHIPLVKRQPVTILHLEQEFKLFKDPFNLKGRLDRIERRGDRIFIIDYKTTSNERHLKINFDKLDPQDRENWNNAIGTLQLPFYLLLYSENEGEQIEDIKSIFLLLGRSMINEEIELPLFDQPEEVQENYEILKTIIFSLLKEIVNQKISFQPATNLNEVCPNCSFQYICGTQWIGRL